MGLTADLIEQAVAPEFSDLPQAAVETVRNAILDTTSASRCWVSTRAPRSWRGRGTLAGGYGRPCS